MRRPLTTVQVTVNVTSRIAWVDKVVAVRETVKVAPSEMPVLAMGPE